MRGQGRGRGGGRGTGEGEEEKGEGWGEGEGGRGGVGEAGKEEEEEEEEKMEMEEEKEFTSGSRVGGFSSRSSLRHSVLLLCSQPFPVNPGGQPHSPETWWQDEPRGQWQRSVQPLPYVPGKHAESKQHTTAVQL